MNYLGIALALVATTAYNAGFVVEKLALAGLPPINLGRPVQLLHTLFTAPGWVLGFLCMALGLACQTLVLALLPISVAQPLQAPGIGVLLLLAWLLLGEKADRRDWLRLATVMISVLLLGLSVGGDTRPDTGTADPTAMLAVLGSSALLTVPLYAKAHGHRSASGVSAGLATGLLYGMAGLGLKALSSQLTHRPAVDVLAALPRSPYLYLVAGASLVGMALFQTTLQRFRASVVVPTSNVAGSCYVLLLGSWLFHERLPTDPVILALRVAGLLTALLALAIQPAARTAATAATRQGESTP
ncbi:hypothetical protein [Amycolatopsis sp. H20-H5]|uniref:hypothetical protein n=1 Tax=Amycolatopsis sp. H20-H5 TaxID=3046309 RepID=UPI002DBFFDAD|nr:hypothetical protein [Amycolatopsis sp. H20-H5]MEC3980073.1 hypothetical protein [Amycolatopsis sp. H20-H5]